MEHDINPPPTRPIDARGRGSAVHAAMAAKWQNVLSADVSTRSDQDAETDRVTDTDTDADITHPISDASHAEPLKAAR